MSQNLTSVNLHLGELHWVGLMETLIIYDNADTTIILVNGMRKLCFLVVSLSIDANVLSRGLYLSWHKLCRLLTATTSGSKYVQQAIYS